MVDVAHTSRPKRAIRSTWILLQELDQVYRPVYKTWRLNERAYGALTGLREDRCKAAVGADTWWRWRMSLRARPPPLSADHPLAPHRERKYADLPLGAVHTQPTFSGDSWEVRGLNGAVLLAVTAAPSPAVQRHTVRAAK